jgi:hypothetical protein
MSDTEIHRLKERLLEEYADVALIALREKAGLFLTADEYTKAKEKIMDALQGMTRL